MRLKGHTERRTEPVPSHTTCYGLERALSYRFTPKRMFASCFSAESPVSPAKLRPRSSGLLQKVKFSNPTARGSNRRVVVIGEVVIEISLMSALESVEGGTAWDRFSTSFGMPFHPQ
jgi:hypothetical protein